MSAQLACEVVRQWLSVYLDIKVVLTHLIRLFTDRRN